MSRRHVAMRVDCVDGARCDHEARGDVAIWSRRVGPAEDIRLDAPCPTVGATIVDLTTADATGGRTEVESGKEDPAIFGARLGKA